MKILALDIGGTAVKYGLFQDNNIKFGQFPVKDSQGNENIPESICSFSKEHMPDMIAISTPGPFDFETGTSLMTHKLTSMYNVSLKELLKNEIPKAEILFVHDSTAFALGALNKMPYLAEKKFAAVMLGTGLGYIYLNNGKALLNKRQTPLHPLWNRSFLDGTSEDYVSTRAILKQCENLGFSGLSIKELAEIAREGNTDLKGVFSNYGKYLGMCIELAHKTDEFCEIVIGGQISRSWDLIKDGFDSKCKLKYSIIDNPEKCALYGLLDCCINGKTKYYTICEE